MKRLILGLALAALVLVGVYLGVINLLLARPETRAYLNGLAPERFAIDWRRAWSWYPLRLELDGVHVDGQLPKEQWQIEARQAAASVALLPLLEGRILIHGVDLRDVDLRVRPRPRPDRDDSEPSPYYPTIADRDPDVLVEQTANRRARSDGSDGSAGDTDQRNKDLRITIDGFRVQGAHGFWVSDVRAAVSGSVSGSFSMDTGSGRIALSDGAVDLELESLHIRDVGDSTTGARFQGTLDIPPIIATELSKTESIQRIDIDASIDLPVHNLDFLGPLVGDLGDIDLRGKGRVRGRLRQSDGELLSDTDLLVEASELVLELPPYAFSGDGVVTLRLGPEQVDAADLSVRFGAVNGTLRVDPTLDPVALFTGRDLEAVLHILSADQAGDADPARRLRLDLKIPEVGVPDLSVYDQLIPEKSGLELIGGQGTLSASLELAPGGLDLAMDLGSDDADIRFNDLRGTSDLDFSLRARGSRDARATLDISGTSLRLDDTRLTKTTTGDAGAADAEPWSAALAIATGTLEIPLPDSGDETEPLTRLARAMADHGVGPLLDTASGSLDAELRVSGLDWIAGVLGRPLGLTLGGSGEIATTLTLADGWPVAGTRLVVQPQGLTLGLLEHVISGRGKATLSVEDGDSNPALRLQVVLSEAGARRRDETELSVQQVAFNADILVTGPAHNAAGTARVDLTIPSARITDMAVFNAYLPENTPLTIASGQADLVGDLHTGPDKVEGQFVLTAGGVQLDLDEVDLSGDLRLGVLIRGGAPEEMRFDVTGSSLSLDHFVVAGETATSDRPDWSAQVQLDETTVVWTKPMALTMEATLGIEDTRPFVAMLENARGEHHWIDDLLTLNDLSGHLRLAIDDQGAVLHDALFGADKASIRAKGLSRADHREAMLLVRLKQLVGALELSDGKRQFSVLGARDRYDNYVPGKSALPGRGFDISPKDEPSVTDAPAAALESDKSPPQASKEPVNIFLDADP